MDGFQQEFRILEYELAYGFWGFVESRERIAKI